MYLLLRLCVQDRSNMKDIKIQTETIQLDQFLKWADITESGGQTSMLIANKMIFVNGESCTVKRKKLYPNDIVKVENVGQFRVVGEQ